MYRICRTSTSRRTCSRKWPITEPPTRFTPAKLADATISSASRAVRSTPTSTTSTPAATFPSSAKRHVSMLILKACRNLLTLMVDCAVRFGDYQRHLLGAQLAQTHHHSRCQSPFEIGTEPLTLGADVHGIAASAASSFGHLRHQYSIRFSYNFFDTDFFFLMGPSTRCRSRRIDRVYERMHNHRHSVLPLRRRTAQRH